MKKYISILLSLSLIFALAACGVSPSGNDSAPSADSTQQFQASVPESMPVPTPATDSSSENQHILIAYFSATGNTAEVAEHIAQATGGELFELIPSDPYTSEDLNYNDDNSRVVYEHEHPEAQNIALEAATVDNWDEYDTVFVGYPIWWHEAAWPIHEFITANDFTGKTVIPFCTSGGSDLGDSAAILTDMAGSGDWQAGQQFSGSASQETVQEWVDGLDLTVTSDGK